MSGSDPIAFYIPRGRQLAAALALTILPAAILAGPSLAEGKPVIPQGSDLMAAAVAILLIAIPAWRLAMGQRLAAILESDGLRYVGAPRSYPGGISPLLGSGRLQRLRYDEIMSAEPRKTWRGTRIAFHLKDGSAPEILPVMSPADQRRFLAEIALRLRGG